MTNVTCGKRPTHRAGDSCGLDADHDGRHDWDGRRRIWSRETITEAMQAWAAEHDGYAPRRPDWHKGWGSPVEAVGKGRTGSYPSEPTVIRLFGTWEDAVSAAGLQTRPKRNLPKPRTCPQCAGTYYGSAKYCSRECEISARQNFRHVVAGRDRAERFIAMREQGMSNKEIGEKLGVAAHIPAQVFCRAKRQGLTVPPPPYWSRGPG